MDIPDLTIEKFHIMEDIGPSYKFAFNQAYVGMIIWARKVNFMVNTELSYTQGRFFLRGINTLDPAFMGLLIETFLMIIWQ